MSNLTTTQKLVVLAIAWLLLSGGGSIGGDPSPIPDAGMRVLVTFPEATRDQLPAGQKALLQSPAFRDYLDKNCVKEDAGAGWRIWNDDTDPKNESATWQKLMGIAKGKGAWVVAGNGKRGVNKPLPADEKSLTAILDPLRGNP